MDLFDISTRGDTNITRQAGTSDAERLATCAVKLRDIARQRDEAEARAAEAAKALTTLDSILGNTIADDEPENFRLLIAMQQIARAALATMPAELLAQRERERAQITAALSLLVEIEEPIASTPNGSIFRFRAAMGYLRAALGDGAAVDGLGEAEGGAKDG